jgi:hypothetical protein
VTDKKITEQTAFETAGIPTPSDQENISSTDTISEVIEGIMDNIEDEIYPEPDRKHQ